MKKYFEILKTCALFREIQEADYGPLLSCFGAEPWHYDKGETILGEGDPAEYVGIVLSGMVQVIRVNYYGNRSIMAKLGSGGIFAEAFACAGLGRTRISGHSFHQISSIAIPHRAENRKTLFQPARKIRPGAIRYTAMVPKELPQDTLVQAFL